METDIKETVNKLREVEKKCIKCRYENPNQFFCQGCSYAMEMHNYIHQLEEWAKSSEKAKIISQEIGISEIIKDRPNELNDNVSCYLERMYSFETSANRAPIFYRSSKGIRHWNKIGEIDYNRPMSTPLYQGLRDNNLDLVKEGCKQIDINELDPYGKTPLMYACLHCTLEIVKALVEDGADVNKRDWLGWTPLFFCKDTAIADYLLSVGADINAQDYRGNNLLLHNILNPMEDSGLAFSLNTPLIELLIERGINVNAKDNNGNTALIYLVQNHRNRELIQLLLKNPATDVNIQNNEGESAIDVIKKNIDSIIHSARITQALRPRMKNLEECGTDIGLKRPQEKLELPAIEEVELSSFNKRDIEEYNKIIDILKERGDK